MSQITISNDRLIHTNDAGSTTEYALTEISSILGTIEQANQTAQSQIQARQALMAASQQLLAALASVETASPNTVDPDDVVVISSTIESILNTN